MCSIDQKVTSKILKWMRYKLRVVMQQGKWKLWFWKTQAMKSLLPMLDTFSVQDWNSTKSVANCFIFSSTYIFPIFRDSFDYGLQLRWQKSSWFRRTSFPFSEDSFDDAIGKTLSILEHTSKPDQSWTVSSILVVGNSSLKTSFEMRIIAVPFFCSVQGQGFK